MSDPVSLARNARQSLAQVQYSLQSAADVPAGALDATIALAQAGAALAPIERSLGAAIAPHAGSARDRAREALAALQAHGASPTVHAALEALTAILARLDALAAMPPVSAAPPPPPAVPAAVPPPPQAPLVGPTGTVAQRPSAAAFAAAPISAGTGTVQASDAVRVEVTVDGASPSQFYCRLWGNDVVAQGGLFVAATALQPVGAPVTMRVHLPGGSFEATAVVRWTRQPGDAGGPPGFGVSFVELTEDARRAVNAFARARSPFTYPRE